MEKKKIMIDAGHGGTTDPGAVYGERKEKEDALSLALAVGKILEENGADVLYTRVNDVYDTPYEKADMANEAGADYFISIHRNAAAEPGRGSGTMTLVYEKESDAAELAAHINRELSRTGYRDLGIFERPGLVVLRKTKMPAVLVEAGFIDNPEDNRRFDEQFEEIAAAVASGILDGILYLEEKQEAADTLYVVQTGAYRMRSLAEQQAEELKKLGTEAYLIWDGMYYKVRAGAFRVLDHAVLLEQKLRQQGFPTVIVQEKILQKPGTSEQN